MIHLMLDGVYHQFDRCFGWIDELVLTVELFQNVILQRSAKMVPRESLSPSHGQVHGPNDRRGTIDGLGYRDLVQGNIGI